MSVHRTLPDIRSHRKEQTDSIITFFNDTDMMRFFEKLKESLQELRKELEQTTDFLAQNQVEPSQKEKATLGAENQRTQIK